MAKKKGSTKPEPLVKSDRTLRQTRGRTEFKKHSGEKPKKKTDVQQSSMVEWTGRKIAKVSIPRLLSPKSEFAAVSPFQVSVIHCKSWNVFKRRALEYITLLASSSLAKDKMVSELNPAAEVIKRGSFEITITDDTNKDLQVWSGLKLGPPRRLKFPDPDDFIKIVKSKLED